MKKNILNEYRRQESQQAITISNTLHFLREDVLFENGATALGRLDIAQAVQKVSTNSLTAIINTLINEMEREQRPSEKTITNGIAAARYVIEDTAELVSVLCSLRETCLCIKSETPGQRSVYRTERLIKRAKKRGKNILERIEEEEQTK